MTKLPPADNTASDNAGSSKLPPAAPQPADDRVRVSVTSTQSFARGGQETIAPQAARRPGEGSGLKQQFGRYRVIKALGKGAMGMVYLAEDSQLQRQVALKTPHFEQGPTPDLLERFYREARAAANLNHPNICPVHDVGQIEGTHYISMAYIDGRPLSAFIGSKPQAERQILMVVRKLALALAEAHEHGVVHRDLKPANIMVDRRNEPIIMDFGLARQLQRDENVRITQSGMLIGTPAYMSPEQIDGDSHKVGPASDQFSLGVILYELLTGQLPFRGSLSAVIAQIITKDAIPPSQFRSELDPRTEALCLKMLAKDPARRFASVNAVADEIALILRTPAGKPTTPASSQPAAFVAVPAAAADVRQSIVKKSLAAPTATATLSANDLVSLEELARKCLARHDYDQVIQIVERVPEDRRTEGLNEVLDAARAKADEIAFLICEIDEAIRFKNRATALKKADELLKIKPGHHRALQTKEQFTGYGKGGAARLGPLEPFTRPLNEGGWIPWSALAFGLAVAAAVYGLIVIQLGKTAVVIDITGPGISVAIADQGRKIEIITGPRESKIEVQPGEQELKISYAGLEARTTTFELKKGQQRRVTVSIVNQELVARLDQQGLSLLEPSEKAGLATSGSSGTDAAKIAALTRQDTTSKKATQPSVPPKTPVPPGAPVAASPSNGFVDLFNSRDLAGWKTDPSQPGNWRVENRVLVGSGSEASHLYTERDDYADFHLRIEARINKGGNSGLVFRSSIGPKWPAQTPKFPYGYEAHIDGDKLKDKTGSLFVMNGGKTSGRAAVSIREELVPPGDWFTLEVIAQGEHLEIKVNGGKIATRDDSHFAKGHIALQQIDPQTVIEFRKIEIKELAPVAQVAVAPEHVTPTPGFVPLFNGSDLAGWQTRPADASDWHARNGILSCGVPDSSSFIYSERGDYKNFHLRVEARLKDNANTALFFRAKMPDAAAASPVPETGYKVEMKEPDKGVRTGSIWAIGRKAGQITLNGYGRDDRNVRAGEWFTLEVIAKGSHTVILVNGKGPTNYHWNVRDAYGNGGHIAFEQGRNNPPVEIRRVEIKEFGSSSDVDIPNSAAQTGGGENLLVNGSFEDGPSPGNFKSYNPGSTAIPGWKVTRGQIDEMGMDNAADGHNAIDLHGSPGHGGIEQTFPTNKGRRYRVTFSLTVNPHAKHLSKKMAVAAAGTKTVLTADSRGKSKNIGWTNRVFEFTAVADKSTLEFYTLDKRDPNSGPLIDNVRVVELAGK
jgi:choice-of-anchor C domain-containing protein